MPQVQPLQEPKKTGALAYLPASFFGACMGLSAMCVAWHAMSRLSLYCAESKQNATCLVQPSFAPLADSISLVFAVLAVAAFVMLGVAYALKLITYFESCKQEFLSPLTRPFFATICIALLLLPFALERLGIPEIIGFVVWIFGAVSMLIFSVHIVQFWICHQFELSHITPAWIIPVVGLLDLPLALPLFSQIQTMSDLGYIITNFCIAVGLSFTIMLCTLIFARIVFFAKLPDKLMPTLVIVLAPFGAGVSTYDVFISMQALVIGIDPSPLKINYMFYALFSVGIFSLIALLPQIVQIQRCCPFRISWWAISFPLAAMCIASIKLNINIIQLSTLNLPMSHSLNHLAILFSFLSTILLGFVTLIFIWLIVRTLIGIFRGELQNLA